MIRTLLLVLLSFNVLIITKYVVIAQQQQLEPGAVGNDDNKFDLGPQDPDDWDEYLATSPTIKGDNTFQAGSMADYLNTCFTTKDKKQAKKNKEVVITVVTKLNNKQRQELFVQYKKRYDKHLGEDIKNALGNKGKGKSLYAVLALMQTPAQFSLLFELF